MSLIYIFAILCTVKVHAQTEIFDLGPIKVTAKKTVSEFDFSTPALISSEELEAQPTGLIAPLLRDVPGLVISQNGGPGSRVSFFIRGTEARHVSFTIDGLKINDPSNVDRQFDSAFLSSPFLNHILIHKGPQAVLFGSDALAGLVEMRTRKGENAPAGKWELSAGSFGTVSSSLTQDWKAPGFKGSQGTVTFYKFHTDGISRLNEKRFNATEKDSTDTTQLASSSRHYWSEKISTDILFSFVSGQNELDGTSDDNSNDKSLNDQYLIQQKSNLQVTKSSALSLRNGLNRHNRVVDNEFMGINSESAFSGNLLQNEILYKFEQKGLSLLSGIISEHEELKGAEVERSFDLHSLFLQSAVRVSGFKFHAGGRAERHVRYGSFYTGSAGVAYKRNNHTTFIQYSRGFKAPSLYQLYAPSFPGFPVGNSNLTPEINNSLEGGWKFLYQSFQTEITLFQNRLSNLITYTPSSGFINQSRFVVEGVELAGKFKTNDFLLSSSLTHQKFKEFESPVIGRPLNTFHAGVATFPDENSEVSLKGRWFSSRQGLDGSEVVKLNGFEVVDLGARYFLKRIEIGMQVINILNREYEEQFGYNIMPRSIYTHAAYHF